MKMADPIPQFSYLIESLKPLGLAYFHLVESRISGNADVERTEKIDFALDIIGETIPVVVAGGFNPEAAKRALDEEYVGKNVLIGFGRWFISNPDLVFRIKEGIELTPYDRPTFYAKESPRGYVDYPFSEEFKQVKSRAEARL